MKRHATRLAYLALVLAAACTLGADKPIAPTPTTQPVALESLAMPPAAVGPIIIKAAPSTSFKADAGTYHRDIEYYGPVWGNSPEKIAGAVVPFKSEKTTLPEFHDEDTTTGKSNAGNFTGGAMRSITDAVRNGPTLLIIIGALAVIAGGALWYFTGRAGLGLAVIGGGGLLIGAGLVFETYPWLLLVAAAAAIGLIAWYIIDARFATRAKAALQAVVLGVEQAPDPQAVKDQIGTAAALAGQATVVKATISDAKKAAGV